MENFARHAPWKIKKNQEDNKCTVTKTKKTLEVHKSHGIFAPYMTNAERDTNVTPHPDISTSFKETANTDVSRDSADTITARKKRKTDEIIHNTFYLSI